MIDSGWPPIKSIGIDPSSPGLHGNARGLTLIVEIKEIGKAQRQKKTGVKTDLVNSNPDL